MNIRVAQLSDLEAIVVIYNQAVAIQATADLEPVTMASRKEWFAHHSADQSPILVAEAKNETLGWLSFSEYRTGRRALRHTSEISYYVHTEHRRKGVASHLLRAALERCEPLGIKTLFAILLDNNIGSIGLLQKFGFEQWGHLPGVADFAGREVGHLYYGLRIS